MLNVIWVSMMVVSFFVAFFTGRMDETFKAFLESGQKGVEFILSVGGIMALWSGVMCVAEKSNLTEHIGRFLSPLIRLIFKNVKKGSKAEKAIAMNMTANFLGLSNAATPLGIKAMKELKKDSFGDSASDDMCMLSVINSASIQLIPSTLIAIRASMGSENPGEIILPIWIVSVVVAVFGISCAKWCEKRRKDI